MIDRKLLTKTLKSEPPRFTTSDAEHIAQRYFGMDAQASPLGSERDQNFRLRSGDDQFVLKIANSAEDPAAIDFENAALAHIFKVDADLSIPRIVASKEKENVVVHDFEGVDYLVRCLTWIDGQCLSDVDATPDLRRQLGAILARLGLALRDLSHPAARKPLLWDMQNLPELAPWIAEMEESEAKSLCEALVARFSEHALPKLATMRSQVIFHDLHGGNVYVNGDSPPSITGIADFGDTLYAPLICDVAVAAAYQLSVGDDPLGEVTDFVRAYNEVNALEAEEIDLLPELIMARLVTSLAISTWRARRFPENRDYIVGDASIVIARLKALSRVSAEASVKQLRDACGMS